jgi:hypothetical protein
LPATPGADAMLDLIVTARIGGSDITQEYTHLVQLE